MTSWQRAWHTCIECVSPERHNGTRLNPYPLRIVTVDLVVRMPKETPEIQRCRVIKKLL